MKITNFDPNSAPTLGGPTISTGDPSTTDYGGGLGSEWLNRTTGDAYKLVSITAGTPPSATWVSTTAVSVFSFSTTDGTTTVNPTTELTFVGATLADLGGGDAEITFTGGAPDAVDYLVGTASGALSAEIVVGTTPGGELGGTWASPTVDSVHSGSAHLALGSTSSTAAAGNHTHAGGELLITDTPAGSPLVFADILQNEAGDELLYSG